MEPKSKKLLERLRETQRRFGHRHKTELTYASWVKRFIHFHQFATEAEMTAAPSQAIEKFLHVFPSRKLSRHNQEPDNPRLYRFHKSPQTISKAVKRAGQAAGLDKRVTPHIFRHTFATQLRRQGYEVEQIQKLLGHKQRETTMRYLRGVTVDMSRIVSPLDATDSSNTTIF